MKMNNENEQWTINNENDPWKCFMKIIDEIVNESINEKAWL